MDKNLINMKKYHYIALIFVGIFWFYIASIFDGAIRSINSKDLHIKGDTWLPHMLCSVFTSLIIGLLFYKPICNWTKWKWFLLPILTLASSTIIFAILLNISWKIEHLFKPYYEDIELTDIIGTPLVFLFYSLTQFFIIFYPLALLTQYLVRYAFKKSVN